MPISHPLPWIEVIAMRVEVLRQIHQEVDFTLDLNSGVTLGCHVKRTLPVQYQS